MKKIKYIIFCILLLLPITDYGNDIKIDDDTSSPLAVYLRIAMLFFMLFYIIFDKKNDIKFSNPVNASLFLMIFYIWINSVSRTGSILPPDIIKIFLPFVTYFFFYKSFFRGDTSFDFFDYFSRFFVPIVFLLILLFLSTRAIIRMDGIMAYSDNNGYILLYALPMIAFIRNKRLFLILLIVLILGVILSGKRGAMLGLLLAILSAWRFFASFYKTMTSRDKCLTVIMLLLIVAFAAVSYGDALFQMFQRVINSLSSGGSGRNLIYPEYLQGITGSNYMELIFGHGVYSGISNLSIGQMAHQDWLQIAYDLGLLGVLIYVAFYIALLKEISKIKYHSRIFFYSLILILVIHFVKSLVSCTFLMPTTLVYLYAILGAIMGIISKNKIKKCMNF